LYLVDTNVVSEVRRGTRQAVSWLRSIPPDAVYLSTLTLGEVMRGVALRRRSDPNTAARLTEWLERLRQDHADRILPVTGSPWNGAASLRSDRAATSTG
jgi:hypothetical protein